VNAALSEPLSLRTLGFSFGQLTPYSVSLGTRAVYPSDALCTVFMAEGQIFAVPLPRPVATAKDVGFPFRLDRNPQG